MTKSRNLAVVPGRPPAKEGRDARELLLNSATELFAAHGVAGTTLAMIARGAGLTPAMMHYYFEDKEQLCDAIISERVLPNIAEVWNPVDPKANAAETIEGVVQRMLGRIKQNPWIPSLWVREILNTGGTLRERVVRSAPFSKLRSLSEAVVRGQADGSVNPNVEPQLILSSIVGLVMLSAAATEFLPRIIGKSISPEAVQRHVTSLLQDGVRNRPAKEAGRVPRKPR